jgi:hypothetical protein
MDHPPYAISHQPSAIPNVRRYCMDVLPPGADCSRKAPIRSCRRSQRHRAITPRLPPQRYRARTAHRKDRSEIRWFFAAIPGGRWRTLGKPGNRGSFGSNSSCASRVRGGAQHLSPARKLQASVCTHRPRARSVPRDRRPTICCSRIGFRRREISTAAGASLAVKGGKG